jgi:hypothetical protein
MAKRATPRDQTSLEGKQQVIELRELSESSAKEKEQGRKMK